MFTGDFLQDVVVLRLQAEEGEQVLVFDPELDLTTGIHAQDDSPGFQDCFDGAAAGLADVGIFAVGDDRPSALLVAADGLEVHKLDLVLRQFVLIVVPPDARDPQQFDLRNPHLFIPLDQIKTTPSRC